MPDIEFIERLEALIRSRIDESPDASYTARLAAEGVLAVAQKIGEEGVELALAAAAQNDEAVLNESADLIYHLLVLLAVRKLPLADVIAVLEHRHRVKTAR